MKIPIYQRQVAPSADGVPNAVGAKPDSNVEAIARGANVVGDVVDKAMADQKKADAEYQQKLEEAQQKANVTAVLNARTSWQDYDTSVLHGNTSEQPAGGPVSVYANTGEAAPPSSAAIAAAGGDAKTVQVPVPETGAFNESLKVPDTNQGQPGFLSSRGMDAFAASAPAYESLQKRQQEIAAGLANDEQRKLFLQQTNEMLVDSRRRIEDHVSSQTEVVHQDSLNEAKASALETIANNYRDPKVVQRQVANVVGPAHALLAGRPDAAKQFESELMADAAKVRLNQYLADKDWKGAQVVFAQTKEQLGVQSAHFEAVINTEREKQQAEQRAVDVVDAARLPTGFIDPGKAIATFQALPQAQRDEASQQAFGKWLQLEAAKKKAAVDGNYDSALTEYLGRHSLADISPQTEVWLRTVDPDSWRKLELMQKADQAHARGAPATAAQDRALAQFRLWAADNPDQASQMTEADFNRTWAPQLAKKDRDNGIGVLVQYHVFANKPEKMANAIDAAVLDAGGTGGAGVLPTGERNRAAWDPAALDVYARATAVVQQKAGEFRRKNGKEPTSEDLRKWSTDLFLSGKDPEKGFLGFGGRTTLIEADVKGSTERFQPSFSADQKAGATEALRSAGARIDDASVEAYLRRKHGLPSLPVQAKQLDPAGGSELGLDLSLPASGEEQGLGGQGGGAGDNGAGY